MNQRSLKSLVLASLLAGACGLAAAATPMPATPAPQPANTALAAPATTQAAGQSQQPPAAKPVKKHAQSKCVESGKHCKHQHRNQH
jgi:hypothetical protein